MELKKNIKHMARKKILFQHRAITTDITHIVTSITVITTRPVSNKPRMT